MAQLTGNDNNWLKNIMDSRQSTGMIGFNLGLKSMTDLAWDYGIH